MIIFLFSSCGPTGSDDPYLWDKTYIGYMSVDFSPIGDTIGFIRFTYNYNEETQWIINHHDFIRSYNKKYYFDLIIYDLDCSDTQDSHVISIASFDTGDIALDPLYTHLGGYLQSDIDWYESDTILVWLGIKQVFYDTVLNDNDGNSDSSINDTYIWVKKTEIVNRFNIVDVRSSMIVDTIVISDSYLMDHIRVSPDKTHIAFSYQEGGLGIINMETHKKTMLDTPGRYPIWIDTSTLVFYTNDTNIEHMFDYLSINDTTAPYTIQYLTINDFYIPKYTLGDIISYPSVYYKNRICDINSTGDTLLLGSRFLDLKNNKTVWRINSANYSSKSKYFNEDNYKIISTSGSRAYTRTGIFLINLKENTRIWLYKSQEIFTQLN